PVKKQPWIDPFRFRRRQRTLEPKSIRAKERVHWSNDSRIHGCVEIEATRVISRTDTKRIDLDRIAKPVEAKNSAAFRCGRIMNDRKKRLDDQRVTTGAGMLIVCPGAAVFPKCVH